MRACFIVLLIAFSLSKGSAQPDTTYYSVVNKGKITGQQKVWQSSPGIYRYDYRYNDRGRGDSTSSELRLDASGAITEFYAHGVDYDKNPYEERFALKGDSALWTVNGEKKTRLYHHEFYSANTAPAMAELLVRWILQQPGHRTALLPDGIISAGPAQAMTLSIHGKTANLKLMVLYAEPSPTPFYIWMTEDLRFFAQVNGWISHISRGYESWTDSLFSLQESAAQAFYSGELRNNSTVLAHRILLEHATVFESATATVKKDQTVALENGKISAIYPSASHMARPSADTVIDCHGKFLMPGLWDMHGHYQKDEGAFYLAGGVTHIRDMGNDKILLQYKKQIRDNALLGPELTSLSGFIDREDPFQGPTGTIIRSLEEGLQAIDEYHRLGYAQIKLYSAIKPEWVEPMAAHAHRLGMRVCGHIPSFMTAEQAVKAGYDEITHMNFIFLNFMGDTVDTRTPARFRLVGRYGGSLDLGSRPVKEFVALLKSRHISLDPTMNVWEGEFNEFKGDTSAYLKPVVSWMPQSWLASLPVQSPFGSQEDKPYYKAAFQNMMKMLKMLYDNGILLVAGTDGGEANALHHELELYVKAGIAPNQVLRIATYNAALDCRLQDVYGSIEKGREADLILIDGNPAADISDIRRVELVIKNNRLYRPRQLLGGQGWKYYY